MYQMLYQIFLLGAVQIQEIEYISFHLQTKPKCSENTLLWQRWVLVALSVSSEIGIDGDHGSGRGGNIKCYCTNVAPCMPAYIISNVHCQHHLSLSAKRKLPRMYTNDTPLTAAFATQYTMTKISQNTPTAFFNSDGNFTNIQLSMIYYFRQFMICICDWQAVKFECSVICLGVNIFTRNEKLC